jgi:hypothetical protein
MLLYRVELSQTERGQLNAMLSGGKHAARRIKRAQILLAAGAGANDEEIATRERHDCGYTRNLTTDLFSARRCP